MDWRCLYSILSHDGSQDFGSSGCAFIAKGFPDQARRPDSEIAGNFCRFEGTCLQIWERLLAKHPSGEIICCRVLCSLRIWHYVLVLYKALQRCSPICIPPWCDQDRCYGACTLPCAVLVLHSSCTCWRDQGSRGFVHVLFYVLAPPTEIRTYGHLTVSHSPDSFRDESILGLMRHTDFWSRTTKACDNQKL